MIFAGKDNQHLTGGTLKLWAPLQGCRPATVHWPKESGSWRQRAEK